MYTSARTNNKFWVLLTIVTLSSATMLWSLWHYPLSTASVTAAVLAGFAVLARLARAADAEAVSD